MKPDLNDVVALLGMGLLCAGVTVRYGWEAALIVSGSVILALSVWRAR